MQLHRREIADHHGLIADPGQTVGNGLVLQFEVVGAQIVTDVHVNPDTRRCEICIRGLDGYVVVLAEPTISRPAVTEACDSATEPARSG